MEGPGREADDVERIDELRRRLYRADAGADDLRRYVDERDRAQPLPPAVAVVPAVGPGIAAARRRPLRVLLPLLAAAAVAAVAVASPSWTRGTDTPSTPARPRDPVAAALLEAAGVGGAPGRGEVSVLPPLALDLDGTAVIAQRFRGRGRAALPIDASPVPGDEGRMLVGVSSPGSSPIGWRADRPAAGVSAPEVVGESAAASRRGAPTITGFAWRGTPPRVLVVRAGTEAVWTAIVVLEGAAPVDLR